MLPQTSRLSYREFYSREYCTTATPFFILKRKVLDNVNLIPRGFKILLEILVKGKYKKAVEYPFVFIDRVYGKSKLDLKTYLDFAAQLLDLYLYKLKVIFKRQA